jgi:hypothetical protein
MCWRLLDGDIAPRRLAAWAHRMIGHEGASPLQPLVELDDAYDAIDYIAQTSPQTGRTVDRAYCGVRSRAERTRSSRSYARDAANILNCREGAVLLDERAFVVVQVVMHPMSGRVVLSDADRLADGHGRRVRVELEGAQSRPLP